MEPAGFSHSSVPLSVLRCSAPCGGVCFSCHSQERCECLCVHASIMSFTAHIALQRTECCSLSTPQGRHEKRLKIQQHWKFKTAGILQRRDTFSHTCEIPSQIRLLMQPSDTHTHTHTPTGSYLRWKRCTRAWLKATTRNILNVWLTVTPLANVACVSCVSRIVKRWFVTSPNEWTA